MTWSSLMGIPVSQLEEHIQEEVSWFCRVLACASSESSDVTPLPGSAYLPAVPKTLWEWISARTPSCGHPSIQTSLKPSEPKPNRLSSALFTKGAEGTMCCALGVPTGQSLLGIPAGSRKPRGSDGFPRTGIYFCCLVIFNSEHPVGHNLV